MEEQQSIFATMDPKQSFIVGIVGGLLVICTIGFFILLQMVLSGTLVQADKVAAAGTRAQVAAADTAARPVAQPTAQPTAAPSLDPAPVDSSVDHIRGDVNAPVTIIEYSDLECPFCSRFHDTMKQILAQYDGEVRWVYRHFPLTSIHPNAQPAALAAECAGEQNKFWEFVDAAFAGQQTGGVGQAALQTLAQNLGLNMSQYNECVTSQKYAAKVTADAQDATATGGQGTPHSIIVTADGSAQLISGAQPPAAVSAQLDAIL